MADVKADDSNILETDFGPDGYLTTLHPEGSFNDVRYGGRELVRPDIDYIKASVNVLVPVTICLGVCFWNVWIACLLLGVYTSMRIGSVIAWFVLLYQRYAPADIRLACVFEPSCSEYMILSIKKYGAVYGCIKGVHRLLRCHSPNGGEDYP